MAVFRYSTAFMQIQLNTSNTWSGLGHLTNTQGLRDSGGAGIYVMKGTIPTQGQLDAFNASTWRSGDILISKSVNSAAEAPFDGTNGIIKLAYEQRVATQTGLAEWFLWRGGPGSNQLSHPIFIGTISLPGGGGDMSLTNLNIVSGSAYTIGPATWRFDKRDYSY